MLQAIFQFCERVSNAQKIQAKPTKIHELIEKPKEFEKIRDYEALNRARSTLQDLLTTKNTASSPISQTAPIPSINRNPSLIKWSFSTMYNAAASICSLAGRTTLAIFNILYN